MGRVTGNPVHQSYLDMIRSYAGGWNAMWAALGLSSKCALENRIYERGGAGGQTLSVHDALQMQSFSGTTLFAEAIAQVSGGVFVLSPDIEIDNDDLHKKFNEVIMKLGMLSKKWNDATADGVIDLSEKTELQTIVYEIQQTLLEFVTLSFKVYCPEKK